VADDQREVRAADGRRRRPRGGVQGQRRRAAFLKYISRRGGKIWVSTGAIISPNKQVPKSAYPNLSCRRKRSRSQSAKVFLFDGSDTLPGTLATTGERRCRTHPEAGQHDSILSDFQKKAAKEF
jgi:hypothetical protein